VQFLPVLATTQESRSARLPVLLRNSVQWRLHPADCVASR
jgi:hypothetical protein